MAGLRGAITIGGLAAAIKIMKHWYVKEQKNLQLQKENIAAQLQLLKAQVHPHFLFNTLNNIYAHAQVGDKATPVLVAGLSDLLRYVLYDCNQSLTPLDKESKMLHDYILLEKVRYGNKLELNIDMPAEDSGLYIAPLLLLPLVENCFKHGASQMLDQPWISLQLTVDGDWAKIKLLNAKMPCQPSPYQASQSQASQSLAPHSLAPHSRADRSQASQYPVDRSQTFQSGASQSLSSHSLADQSQTARSPDIPASSGIGIANVAKRLQLLYPGRHSLSIQEEDEVFILNLKLQLERKPTQ